MNSCMIANLHKNVSEIKRKHHFPRLQEGFSKKVAEKVKKNLNVSPTCFIYNVYRKSTG